VSCVRWTEQVSTSAEWKCQRPISVTSCQSSDRFGAVRPWRHLYTSTVLHLWTQFVVSQLHGRGVLNYVVSLYVSQSEFSSSSDDMNYLERIMFNSYPTRSTAVDNSNVRRGKRFSAALCPNPIVVLQLVVARVASDRERCCRSTGLLLSAFSVERDVKLTSVFPSSTWSISRLLHRHAKVYRNVKRNRPEAVSHLVIHYDRYQTPGDASKQLQLEFVRLQVHVQSIVGLFVYCSVVF